METETTHSSKGVAWDAPDRTQDNIVRKRAAYLLIALFVVFAALFLLVPEILSAYYPQNPRIDEVVSLGRVLYSSFVFITLALLLLYVVPSFYRLDAVRANVDGMHVAHSHKTKLALRFVNKKSFVRWSNVDSIRFNTPSGDEGTGFWITVALKEPLPGGSTEFVLVCPEEHAAHKRCQELKRLAAGQ
jgi:hypothetical protein